MTRGEEVAAALGQLRQRIRLAEQAAGRPAGSVRLIAVSKTMPAADIEAALAAGQRDFGENYAQELRDKRAALAARPAALGPVDWHWHFIGPLQRNKVKYVAGQVALIHSVDSAEILHEVNRRTATMARTPDPESGTVAAVQECLLQVNIAGEAQKRGVPPSALPALLDEMAALANVRCRGLMLIPPLSGDPETGRPHFAALRRLRDQLAAATRPNVSLTELSMGMSHDLEVAIAEGATMVRVGTAIFGARAP